MQKYPKQQWNLHFDYALQKKNWALAFWKLDHGYRWQVESALNHMLHTKHPWKKYVHIICHDCVDDLYLLNVSHKGIGDKTVQIMIKFNKSHHKITPIHCELLKK